MEASEAYYEQFKAKLTDSQPWPGPYLYKFIVKQDSTHGETITSWFAEQKINLTEKESAKGSYRSLTILAENQTPDTVIDVYKQVKELPGVIIL